jgi:hypothetical protein
VLWLGSCNFTQASDFNHEMMIKLVERGHPSWKPGAGALQDYMANFDRVFQRGERVMAAGADCFIPAGPSGARESLAATGRGLPHWRNPRG